MTGKRALIYVAATIILSVVIYCGVALFVGPDVYDPTDRIDKDFQAFMHALDHARKLRAGGKLQDAEAAFLKILDDFKDNASVAHSIFEPRFDLAELYKQRGKNPQAEEQYTVIIERSGMPDSIVRARIERAALTAMSGDDGLKELQALYDEFRRTPEVCGKICARLADALVARKRCREAADILSETLLSKLTESATLLSRLSNQLNDVLDTMAEDAAGPEEAAEVYIAQVKKFPTMAGMCWQWLEKAGFRYMEAGQYARARNAFNEIARDYPGSGDSQARVGYEALDKLDEAERTAGTRLSEAGAEARIEAGEKIQLVRSDIKERTVWSPDDGTYVVAGEVAVRKSAELVIKAGTRVEFCLHAALVAYGRIAAEGTAARPITFTSAADHPSFFDWEGVQFIESTGGVLEHAVISHARKGVVMKECRPRLSAVTVTGCGGVAIENRNPPAEMAAGEALSRRRLFVLVDLQIVDNPGYGMVLERSAGSIVGGKICTNGKDGIKAANASAVAVVGTQIHGNRLAGVRCADHSNMTIAKAGVSDNGGAGIAAAFSSPIIRDCEIRRNGGPGVAWSSNSNGKVVGSTIAGNTGGVECTIHSLPTIEGCTFEANKSYGVKCESGCDPKITSNRFTALIGPGILIRDICRPTIKGNHFPEKGIAIRHEGEHPVDASHNVWPEDVEARKLVEDAADGVGKGEVILLQATLNAE